MMEWVLRRWGNPRVAELSRMTGVRVIHWSGLQVISACFGIWPLKCILVGTRFWELSDGEQYAVLYHELGHYRLWHHEKRLLYAPLLLARPSLFFRLCRDQEFEADAFAASQGFGGYLSYLFSRMVGSPSKFHPDFAARIERLRNLKGA